MSLNYSKLNFALRQNNEWTTEGISFICNLSEGEGDTRIKAKPSSRPVETVHTQAPC